MNKKIRSMMSCLLAVILLAAMLPMTAAAASTPFIDVADIDWFAKPVLWAVENGVTSGITPTAFGPNNPCTRAQVVTFLWAAEGKPEPTATDNPFTDVADDAWYVKPVLWAVEQGITGGTSPTTFSPDNECTRAQIVTFLYAAAGKPDISGSSEFSDVADSDWFAKPVIWAKENAITGGTSPTTFGPLDVCTRGQVVTFLWAANGKPEVEVTPAPTPEVTPSPEPISRETAAFTAMRDWILSNYNNVEDNTYYYSEAFEEEGGQIVCALIYTPGTSYIEVAAWMDVVASGIPAYFDTYLVIEEGTPTSDTSMYFYIGQYSDDGLLFEGYAQITDAEFCEASSISFYESYGDTANTASYAELVKYTALSALSFADGVLQEYIPGDYTIADLGYTNIYN